MSVIHSGAHPKALWPGVHAFAMASYKNHPTLYTEVFDVEKSKMAYEEDVEMSAFDLPQVKPEGAALMYTGNTPGPTKRYTHVAWALGYMITREMLADNLYEDKSFEYSALLARSFKVAKEMVHWNVLNRAFSSSYLGIDGKELLATDHPTQGGTQQNEPTVAADLTEASLEDMLTLIMSAKNSKGHPIVLTAKKLVVAPGEAFNAQRILNSTGQNDTGNNAINAVKSMGLLSGGVVVSPYLTDTDAWFITTDAPHGLISFQRQAYTFEKDNDFETKNAKASGYERYSCGWTDWRAVFGSPGA